MFQNLIDIIAAPSAAFTRLKEKPTVRAPLLLVLLAIASVQLGYILLTDRGFLADQQIEQTRAIFSNLSDAQVDQMRQQMLGMSSTSLILQSVIPTVIIYSLILALYALYLRVVAKFSFVELDWKAWMSLVAWTSVPSVLGALASWAVLLTNSNGQVSATDLNPLTFSNLLGLESGGPLSVLTPLYLWSFVLLALGYQNWTGKSLVASALISLAPYFLIFGIWGFFSL